MISRLLSHGAGPGCRFSAHSTSPATLLVLICFVTGCVSAPDVSIVPQEVAQTNLSLFGGDTRNTHELWWQELHDPELNELISTGLMGSPTTQIALARLAQAEQELIIAKSARWPSLSANGNRDVRNFQDSVVDTRADLGVIGFGWDLGLWGKRRLEIENARQFRDELWFTHQSVELALSTSIAETYYEIVESRAQGELLDAQLQVSRDLERLIEARFRLGQAPVSELYQQRESTSMLEQLQLANTTREGAFEKTLDVLLGEIPDAIPRVSRLEVPATPKNIGLGMPEDLIRHRADIRMGYARLKRAATEVGISFTERLPSLQVSANLTSLAEKALSSVWVGHGINLALPLLSGGLSQGRLRSEEQRALYALEEERQRYHELWLNALQEVTTLQLQYQQQLRIIDTLRKRRGHSEQALSAARNRYILGDQNYLDVLTALRGLQETERLLFSEQRQRVLLWIRTVESIGQPMCANRISCRDSWQL